MLTGAVRSPSDNGRENRMAFTYRLEQEDGTPADPPTFRTAVPTWRAGDTVPLSPGRALRVIAVRDAGGDDEDPVLVVEDGTT
jgi:hypothetical protein